MQINTRFNVGDKVHFLYENKIVQEPVCRINIEAEGGKTATELFFRGSEALNNGVRVPEHECFETKQDLLDSL